MIGIGFPGLHETLWDHTGQNVFISYLNIEMVISRNYCLSWVEGMSFSPTDFDSALESLFPVQPDQSMSRKMRGNYFTARLIDVYINGLVEELCPY